MNKFIFSTFFCAVVLILAASDVFGCTCIVPEPVEDQYKRNAVIFSGKVISLKNRKYYRNVKISVEKSWKGKLPKTITVLTASSGVVCGYNFAVGKKYLIYTTDEDVNNLHVSICSRTALLSEAKEDVKELNALEEKSKSSPK